MDLLSTTDEINSDSERYGIKIQYATLSEYFDAVFATKTPFPLYKGDFFPYADNADSYWTVRCISLNLEPTATMLRLMANHTSLCSL